MTTRSRTITWEDPLETFGAAAELSGLEFLQAIGEGRLPQPPMAELMGFEGIEVEEGRVVFAAVPDEYHYNPIGVVHAGLAMTLLDSAMGCAVQSTLPAGSGYTTLETKVNFARADHAATRGACCARGRCFIPAARWPPPRVGYSRRRPASCSRTARAPA